MALLLSQSIKYRLMLAVWAALAACTGLPSTPGETITPTGTTEQKASVAPTYTPRPTATLGRATDTLQLERATPTLVPTENPLSNLGSGDFLLISEQMLGSVHVGLFSLANHSVTPLLHVPGAPDELLASRDGKLVALLNGGGIRLFDLETGLKRNIANSGGCAFIGIHPVKGPTGSCNDGQSANIFIFDDVDAQRNLVLGESSGAADRLNGTWSADGSELLFLEVFHRPPQPPRRELMLWGDNCITPCIQRSFGAGDLLTSSAWSSGELYALGALLADKDYPSILIVDAQDGRLVHEHTIDVEAAHRVSSVTWAPTDEQLALAVNANALYILDISDGTLTQVLVSLEPIEVRVLAWISVVNP